MAATLLLHARPQPASHRPPTPIRAGCRQGPGDPSLEGLCRELPLWSAVVQGPTHPVLEWGRSLSMAGKAGLALCGLAPQPLRPKWLSGALGTAPPARDFWPWPLTVFLPAFLVPVTCDSAELPQGEAVRGPCLPSGTPVFAHLATLNVSPPSRCSGPRRSFSKACRPSDPHTPQASARGQASLGLGLQGSPDGVVPAAVPPRPQGFPGPWSQCLTPRRCSLNTHWVDRHNTGRHGQRGPLPASSPGGLCALQVTCHWLRGHWSK